MITLDYMAFVRALMESRQLQDFTLDVLRVPVESGASCFYSSGQRAFYFLLSHDLPVGCSIASERSALLVDEAWLQKDLAKIHEFYGQLAIELPDGHSLSEIEFLRVIPRL
jgi:hypothetical protein